MSGVPEIMVTLGRCDDMRAEVYLRPRGDGLEGARLVGVVSGPFRGSDVTLPTSVRLDALPDVAAAGPASRVILTEPAFWTPDSPNIYRADLRLELPDGTSSPAEAAIGLRRLGVRGRSFWLDGRRWVPRAAAGIESPGEARRRAVGMVTAVPDEPLLARADQIGVPVVVVMEPDGVTATRIAAVSRHPSVTLTVVIDRGRPESLASAIVAAGGVKGTMQIGVATADASLPPVLAEACDFITVMLPEGGLPDDAWRRPPQARPVVAWRRAVVGLPEATRPACDALQRDLAAWGLAGGANQAAWDWAGYLVG